MESNDDKGEVTMPRPLQSASLSFGLVSIPVKLYTAARDQSVSFHLLHEKDGSRIREQIVCVEEDKVVSRKELVRGYEVRRGKYVEITEQELDALEAEANRNVDIQEFVPADAVDPVYFKKTYYLGPDKGGDKPYVLFAQAMLRERQAAIAQLVQRGKEQLVMIRPVSGDTLMAHVLYYRDEVRAVEEAPAAKTASAKELDLAVQLIRHLASKTWDPSKYHDTYRERVMALIKKKEQGAQVVVPKPGRTREKVLDLTAALKRSLAGSGEAKRARRATRPPGKGVKRHGTAA
jgi:DNA end-binding protein Ku